MFRLRGIASFCFFMHELWIIYSAIDFTVFLQKLLLNRESFALTIASCYPIHDFYFINVLNLFKNT